jgi:hypothetical protein
MPVVFKFIAAFDVFCVCAITLLGRVIADPNRYIGSRKSNPAGGSGNVRQPGTGREPEKS